MPYDRLNDVKRAAWLAPFALLAVWGIALLDVGVKQQRSEPPYASAEPREQEPSMPVPPTPAARLTLDVAKAEPEVKAPMPAPAHEGPERSETQQESTRIADRHTSAPTAIAIAAEQDLQLLGGELGEGIGSREYGELEGLYTREVRDGPWAREQEARVNKLLDGQPINGNLVLVHCQETVCRIVLEGAAPDSFEKLLRVPGMRQETGLSSKTPYSLRGGQFSLYFKRAEEH